MDDLVDDAADDAGDPAVFDGDPTWPGLAGYRLRGIQGRLIRTLGHKIVAGVYRPGALLPRESELMAGFRASRTSVREAIKVLSAKGLVETRQRIGTRVRDRDHWNIFDADVLGWHTLGGFDQAILKDLVEMRLLVEPPAAGFAAVRASLDDAGRIADAYEHMRRSVDDLEAYSKADLGFHMAVFAASNNVLLKRFAHTVANFLEVSFRIQQQAIDEATERLQDDLALHAAIADAIHRGDGPAAENAMLKAILDGKAHLQRTRSRFRERPLSAK